MNVNQVFLDRMKQILKNDYETFLKSLEQPIEKSVYVNENKISVEEFKSVVDFQLEQIPYEKAGFYVDSEKKGRHPLHHAGAFYLQEPSAMFTVNAIKFKGDEKVLDMCAAPGGKTIQIANRIPNGVLVSNEIVKSRSEILFSNVERMGLKNVIISNESPEKIGDVYGNTFDVVLVDAPCSGEGMFRRGDEVLDQWYPELNEMCAKRQIEILTHADKTLKQNGILIYSTCTYSTLENEAVVREFLKGFDYQLIDIEYGNSRGIEMREAVRLYPHTNRGEGQFVAVLKKKSNNTNFASSSIKFTNSKLANDFIKEYLNTNFEIVEYKGYSYFVPQKELVKKNINYVSIGVRCGSVVNNRFEPHHNLFTALGEHFKNKLMLKFDENLTKKYLRGETLEIDLPDGFGCVFINGCALGGFKVSKGKFKNHYPKGLRNY